MKKYLLPLLAVAALFGCQKEQEEIDTPNKTEGDVPVYTITGHITEPIMKTYYDFVSDPSKGDFSWVAGDQVDLILLNGGSFSDTTPVTLSAETPTDGGKTVVFTNLLSEHASPSERFSIDTWESSGFAVYPQGLARDNKSCPYSSPYVKLRSTVGGVASEIALVGTPDNDVTPTNFNFKTAMGVLKVTLTGIPAEAASLKLTTTNKATDPLDGDFSLIKNGSGIVEITKSNYLVTGGAPNGYGEGFIKVDLSKLGAIASRDFYFNIPTGDYAAGTLSLTLANGSGEELLHKTINKNLTFTRGTVIAAKSLSNEWITLGTGQFYDKIKAGSVDASNYYHASVTIQQNVADVNTYRVVNPYGKYWEANGVSPEYTPDTYLTFTVNPSTSLVTSFENHKIGRNFDGSSNNIVIRHPSVGGVGPSYVGPQDASKNKVWQWNGSIPAVVQLAPIYCYSDYSNGWNKHAQDHLVEIIFPGYDTSVTLASDSAPTDETFHITLSGANVSSAKAGCKATAASAFTNLSSSFAPATGTTFNGFTGNGNYPRYIAVCAYNSDGTEIFHDSFNKTIYTINSADAAKLVGTFTHTITNSCYGGNAVGRAVTPSTIALIVSTDVFAGNVMISSFDGEAFSHSIPGEYTSSDGYKCTFSTTELWKANNFYLYRASGPNTNPLVLQFVDDTLIALYSTEDFGVASTNTYPPTWSYWYRGGSEHVYSQPTE